MNISASISSAGKSLEALVTTGATSTSLTIPAKEDGRGSSVNGGELLFLALATCFCNDLYREAGLLGITITSVTVEVHGTFGDKGAAARDVSYDVTVVSPDDDDVVERLVRHTDVVSEIQNSVRTAIPVVLDRVTVT